ncbi:hypothetical protein Mapa_008485 [Marchantia paleacea]|nr:hypothetical protein Mapa_008485 [Marchantia paleacea]
MPGARSVKVWICEGAGCFGCSGDGIGRETLFSEVKRRRTGQARSNQWVINGFCRPKIRQRISSQARQSPLECTHNHSPACLYQLHGSDQSSAALVDSLINGKSVFPDRLIT